MPSTPVASGAVDWSMPTTPAPDPLLVLPIDADPGGTGSVDADTSAPVAACDSVGDGTIRHAFDANRSSNLPNSGRDRAREWSR